MEWGSVGLDVAVVGADHSLDVVSCRLREALSERTHASIVVATFEDVDFEPLLCAETILTLSFEGTAVRSWTLRLGRASFAGYEGGGIRHVLDAFDAAYLLGLRRNTRKFRNASAADIVGSVLDEARIPHRCSLERPPPVRKFCTQYRETDLDFVERILASEGIYYAFEPYGTMVMLDASVGAPRIDHGAPIELSRAAGALRHAGPAVVSATSRARVTTGRVTLGDHNWKKPKLPLRETARAERDILLERFEYPGGFRLPEQGAVLARLRLEAHRARARELEGRGTYASFAPGLAFSFGATAGRAHAGDWLLRAVEHRYVSGGHAGPAPAPDATTYENAFRAMPLGAPFRPPVATPHPQAPGLSTAFVRGPAGEEIYTDRYGRFRAQFHWDREGEATDEDSRWLRPLQESSTSMALARTGWEVFVGYVAGDADRPVGLGRAINTQAAPSYSLPDNKSGMTVKSPSSPATGGFNELRMDDGAGAQAFALRAERDLCVLVKNDKTERIGHDEAVSVGTDLVRTVHGNQTVTIGKDATASVGQGSTLRVDGARSESIGSGEKVEVKGTVSVAVGGSEVESVGILRLTSAGTLRMPDWKSMAKSAAEGFLSNVSPAGAQAYQTAQTLRARRKSGKGGGKDAALKVGLGAVGGAIRGARGGGGTQGAAQGAGEGALSSMFPGQSDWSQYASSEGWLTSKEGMGDAAKGALGSATGGLSDGVTVGKLVNLFCVGGIERAASTSMFKMVGGCYVTAALLGIGTQIGLGYLEAVGGLRLTFANAILQSVDGKMKLLVGGTAIRAAGGSLTVAAKAAANVSVAGAALYDASASKLLLKGKTIALDASSSLSLAGGSAKMSLSSSSASLAGDLKLDAGGTITLTGKASLDIVK